MASSDAKSKWDAKTQAIFKHRPLSSLRKKLKGVKRREDKEKTASITTTTTPVPEVTPVTMPSVMPIVPFDSIYAAASQATYVPPLFDPMAQYLPPPPSFISRAGPPMLTPIAPHMASNPIYFVIQKPPTPHPYDALNALPTALIAHMAQLHYDMLQQNRGHSGYLNEESDPRDTNHGPYARNSLTEKGRSKYFSSSRDKEGDLKRPDDTNSGNNTPVGQESSANGNSNSINGGKYDRISDRSGQEKKEFGFGFPGREIDTRDGDLHHSDYHSNGNLLNQDERDVNGNLLPMATVTTQMPDLPPHNGGHRNNGHPNDHHDHHHGY